MIVYREYLPLVLGPVYMKRFGLELQKEGYWEGEGQGSCYAFVYRVCYFHAYYVGLLLLYPIIACI